MVRLGTAPAAGLLALVAALAQVAPLAAQERPGRQAEMSVAEMAELREAVRSHDGRVIVGFKPATAERGVSPTGHSLLSGAEIRAVAEDLRDVGLERTLRDFDLIPAVVAVVDASGLEALLADPRVDYVEPDRLVDPMEITAPGALPGAEMAQEVPWGIDRIGAPEAWSITRGTGVSIGIIDSGIDADHPDLTVAGGINLVTGGTTSADWDDASPHCSSHGTHVAGTAAALDNDVGVVGVAPAADLYALRVFDPEADGLSGCQAHTSSVIAALDWSVTQGLDVVNMSLGSFFSSFAKLDAARAAEAGGVFMVAAAGNSGDRFGIGYPAAYPEVVAVGAIDDADLRAGFSSTGPELEMMAPGVDVVSTTADGTTGSKNGTSMASPHVSGLVALLRAAAPGLTGDELRTVVASTTTDLGAVGFDEETGHGLVAAAAAVGVVSGGQLLMAATPQAVSFWAPPGANPASATVTLAAVGTSGSVSWSASSAAAWLQVSPTSGTLSAGSSATLTLTGDPSNLAELVHPTVVTITGDGGNTSIEVPVRFAVAPQIAPDASMSWPMTLPSGADPRKRFVLSGTAGDRVDIAVVEHGAGQDPILWLYMPDGRTVLARNDDAREALLGRQSLLYDVTLPETGDYFVEVGSDGLYTATDQSFSLKARPAGPILGVDLTQSYLLRAEAGGAPASFDLTVGNLSAAGTLEWSASPDQPWLSLSPTSGSATGPAPVVESGPAWEREMERRRGEQIVGDAETPPEIGLDGTILPTEGDLDASDGSPMAVVSGQVVTFTADPGALAPDDHQGVFTFTTADGWLDDHRTTGGSHGITSVSLRAYTPGIAFLSFPTDFLPLDAGGLNTDVPSRLSAFSRGIGSIHSVGSDGVVSSALVSNIQSPTGSLLLGMGQGPDGAWYVGMNSIIDPTVLRVSRQGEVSIFAQLPFGPPCGSWPECGTATDVAPAPGGGLFVSDPLGHGGFWRVSADGEVGENYAPETYGLYIDYSPHEDAVYLSGYSFMPFRISMTDLTVSTLTAPSGSGAFVADVAVGRSGRIYGVDTNGVVWVWEPGSTAAPTRVAFLPERIRGGLALLEGELVVTTPFTRSLNAPGGIGSSEGYRIPVSDGPAVYGDVAAGFDFAAATDALRGEPITIPVALETLMSGDGTAALDLSLQWSTADLDFQGYTLGAFGGTTVTDNSASGALQVTGSQAEAAWGEVPVLSVTFATDAAAAPGDTLGVVDLQVSSLTGTSGADLTPFLTTGPGAICVDTHGYGDVGRDGTLGSADAVQALIAVAGGTLAEGADPDLADVSGDGEITVTDPVWILRQLVELPLPESNRIGAYGVGGCR